MKYLSKIFWVLCFLCCVSKQNRLQSNTKHIAIIHSYRDGVINTDNKMITLAHIGRIIWINQIIKRNIYSAENKN